MAKDDVNSIIKMVRPKGEKPQGFDDRMDFDEAVEMAEYHIEYGKTLLNALNQMKEAT